MIKLSRDVAGPCLAPRGSVVAVGAFDGLHRGHQALLAEVRERAQVLGCEPVVVSFEPLPRALFLHTSRCRGCPACAKSCCGFDAAGMSQALLLRFNDALAAMSAEDFVHRVLVRAAGRARSVGGRRLPLRPSPQRRCGDAGADGSVAAALPPAPWRRCCSTVERVSATRVRELLAAGDFAAAAPLLGRPFVIEGKVEYGNQLGRTLGYPTANIHLRERVSPVHGIFAVRVGLGEGECAWPGVASLGVRPTVNEVAEPLLEVHLFDFEGDLYGQRMAVEFVGKLRDEQKFDGLEALTAQMDRDASAARAMLGMNPRAGGGVMSCARFRCGPAFVRPGLVSGAIIISI